MTLRCNNNHCFDIAKTGHVNLHPAHFKNSKAPGDTKLMVQSRRIFLEKSYYQPLAEAISRLHQTHRSNATMATLDCGCGEGYFSRFLQQQSDEAIEIYGIDISKHAIIAAAKRCGNNQYAVASSQQIPILNDSIDFAFRCLAPSKHSEIVRLLKTSGYFLIIEPGEQHLQELRELIYQSATPHQKPIEEINQLASISQHDISFKIHIDDNEDIRHLVHMTPYNWVTTKDVQTKLFNLNELSLTAHFSLRLYQKR